MLDVSTADFDAVVLGPGAVLVDYWAPWCPPCRAMQPNLERLAKEFDGRATFVKVNVEAEKGMNARFGITSIPILIVFRDGKEVGRRTGTGSYPALREFIEKSIAT